jgi:hypothetical protein
MKTKPSSVTLQFPIPDPAPKTSSLVSAFDAFGSFARIELVQKQQLHNIYVFGAGPAITAPCDRQQSLEILRGKLEAKQGATKKTASVGESIALELGKTYTFKVLEGPVIAHVKPGGGHGSPGNQNNPIIR